MENSKAYQSRRFSLRVVLVALMAVDILTGCASVSPEQWRQASQSYDAAMNADYERLNRYRQGPAARVPEPTVNVIYSQRCETWPYCPN